MSQYRYTITDRLGVLIASPLGESDFSVEWGQDRDNGKRRYEKTFRGKITFVGEAYERLLTLEESPYRCSIQNINIERGCNNGSGAIVWKPWFNGTISLNNGEWDLDGCKVAVSFDENNPEKCFEDNKSTVVDLFKSIFVRQKVNLYRSGTSIETKTCTQLNEEQTGLYWCEGGNPSDGRWVAYYHREVQTVVGRFSRTTKWARQVMDLPCGGLPPSEDWLLISENCLSGGSRKYVKEAIIYNCQHSYQDGGDEGDYTYTMDCQIMGEGGGPEELRNGIFLNQAIEIFAFEFCPGITVKSSFFQINQEIPSDFNYVTGGLTKVANIMLFQKSDVKRPLSTGVATKAEWTFEKLMTALKNMFNVEWRIENGEMIIEHVSYFQRMNGFDLTLPQYAKYVKGKRKYTYKKEDIPKREHWQWMEQRQSGDFPGLDIVYEGCVSKEGKDIIKNYPIEDVNTDLEFIMQNPDPNSEIVKDTGFVFVATRFEGGGYYVISEAGILEEGRLNNSLAIAQLQRDYFRHERPLKIGNMNGEETTFISTIPVKQGATIAIPLCCSDDFDPDKKVITPLGSGVVDKAVFNFKTSMLELDLLYEAHGGGSQNNAPVAKNVAVTTYQNEEIFIDIDASDSDGVIMGIELVTNPLHGSAEIIEGQIKYVPAVDHVGDDAFTYRVFDNWGERSNNALIHITIRAENAGPVANPDFYTASINTLLAIPAPGVFVNDNDDVGFTLLNYQAIGSAGGVVSLDPNGSFTYMPVTDYRGADTFTYTIIDQKGLTATGTVTINVTSEDTPIANPDFYQTTMDTALETDGVFPNLSVLANDTTPLPGSYTYTALEETKPTDEGGSVTISESGDFIYTPAAGFLGKDTFSYTVSNGIQESTGVVTINVLPVIYVSMAKENTGVENKSINCGGMQNGGFINRADYVFRFYSDAAGTVPLDVTGLDVSFVIEEGVRFSANDSFESTQSIVNGAFGNVWIWKNQVVTRETDLDCEGVQIGYYDWVAELGASSGYTII